MIASRRRRLTAHAIVFFLAWPLATIGAATIEGRFVPYISVPWLQALGAASGAVLLLAPDVVVSAAGLVTITNLVFVRLGRDTASFGRLLLEPFAVLAATFCATAIVYPGVLSHAALLVFWPLPAALVIGCFVFLTIHLVVESAPRGSRLRLCVVLGALGFAMASAPMLAGKVSLVQRQPSDLVVLGIDSLAQSDDVTFLRKWVNGQGGAWYERAVAPGLLTNAVWASVMTMQPVRQHGVFHTFQQFPAGGSAFVEHARRAGFHTISVFSDQLTCAIGSQAGFDEDRSGPIGWRQLALSVAENSSLVLPLVRPLLPRAPWSAAPPNHAGTFTYDVTREVREILTSGAPGRKTLVAAHLTYLHMAAYPKLTELSWGDVWRIAWTPAGDLRDKTLDWEHADRVTDPVPLRGWKVARLQRVLAETVDSTGFVARGKRLLVFSDHGQRNGLTPRTFVEDRYHHVVLASIGLAPRAVADPVSLVDVGSLLGLAPPAPGRAPVVEFASPPKALWERLAATADLHWSGAVELDRNLLAAVFSGLKSHQPWHAARAHDAALHSVQRP